MPFIWYEYIRLAVFLRDQPAEDFSAEAARRTAVSRAYYGAFCHARNHAQAELGYKPEGRAADHTTLRTHLTGRGKREIAQKLDQLRQWRNKCDYEDTCAALAQILPAAIAAAQKVVGHLK